MTCLACSANGRHSSGEAIGLLCDRCRSEGLLRALENLEQSFLAVGNISVEERQTMVLLADSIRGAAAREAGVPDYETDPDKMMFIDGQPRYLCDACEIASDDAICFCCDVPARLVGAREMSDFLNQYSEPSDDEPLESTNYSYGHLPDELEQLESFTLTIDPEYAVPTVSGAGYTTSQEQHVCVPECMPDSHIAADWPLGIPPWQEPNQPWADPDHDIMADVRLFEEYARRDVRSTEELNVARDAFNENWRNYLLRTLPDSDYNAPSV